MRCSDTHPQQRYRFARFVPSALNKYIRLIILLGLFIASNPSYCSLPHVHTNKRPSGEEK